MKNTHYLLAFGACASLSACSSTPLNMPSVDELLRADTEQNGRACVRQNDIRGYGILDDDVISVDARGSKRYYLITTLFQCHSLQTSFAAGFKGDFFELCGGGRDKILTSQEACPIKSIFEFESREKAFEAFEKAELTRKQIREQAKKDQDADTAKDA